jgi:hypothetical protein
MLWRDFVKINIYIFLHLYISMVEFWYVYRHFYNLTDKVP